MIRALLVEDEEIERKGILRQADWLSLGVSGVDDVTNGFEAMDNLKTQKYDILITDVKMPYISGIALAQKARALYPDISIIFISGYDDFDFVKSALQLDACEYILKPIGTHELNAAIKKAVETSASKHAGKSLLKDKTLRNLLYGTISEGDISVINGKGVLDLFDGGFICVSVEAGKDTLPGSAAIAGQMLASTDGCYKAESLQTEPYIYTSIASFPDQVTEAEAFAYLSRGIGICADTQNEPYGRALTVGVGSWANSIFRIRDSYQNSRKALLQKNMEPDGKPYYYKQDAEADTSTADIRVLDDITNGLSECVMTFDREKAFHLIDYFFENHAGQPYMDASYVKSCCIHIISRLQITLLNLHQDINDILGGENLIWEKLLRFETLVDTRMWMKNIYTAVIDKLNDLSNENNEITARILAYIEKEYSKDISLKKIAIEMYYSANHLGLIFKQKMGKGFMEYLIEYRMKRVAEILAREDIFIYQAANRVGYKNIPSFIRHFKDIYHTTPAEYKERFFNHDAPGQ